VLLLLLDRRVTEIGIPSTANDGYVGNAAILPVTEMGGQSEIGRISSVSSGFGKADIGFLRSSEI